MKFSTRITFVIRISAFASLVFLAACEKATDQVTPPLIDQTEPADLVLKNAYVYTVDPERSVAEAIAIKGKQIVFVGSNEDVATYVNEATEVHDLQGAMVMPGIHDMHIHALGTVAPDMCDLDSRTLSLEELVPVLQECIEHFEIPAGEWLVVLQWNFSENNKPSDRLPNMRAALDAVSAEHPVFMWGNDGHHGAANSAAFALATSPDNGEVVGMNAETLPTVFAEFQPMVAVDENGNPTGGINETARMLIRPDFMGDFLGANADPAGVMPRVAAVLAENGITSIQDAWVTPEMMAMYGWLEQNGDMTFRLRAALDGPRPASLESIDDHLDYLKTIRDQYRNSPLIEANAVKLFADSVLEGNPLTSPPTLPVAAMLDGYKQPLFSGSIEDGTFDIAGYVDQNSERCQTVQADPDAFADDAKIEAFKAENGFFPQQCIPYAGILEHSEEYIRSYIRKATEAGFHVHVHALADKGVRVTSDEFAKVKDLADQKGLTQSIAHAQVVHPDDQKRIGELELFTVFTLIWTESGIEYEMSVAPFIDEVDGVSDLYNPDHYYIRNVYPAKSILEQGGIIVHGSDAPVGTRDPIPMLNLEAALTRGSGETVLNANERLNIHEAIAAFTINGARLFGHDDRLGSIETGKIADLVVLDQNIVELAQSGQPERIGETRAIMTLFDGNIIFERQGNPD